MRLQLCHVIGYNDDQPKYGEVVASFKGNQKSCISQAKKWIKENPNLAIGVAYKWAK